MVVRLEARLEGADRIGLRIEKIALSAADLTPVWPAVARWYSQRALGKFAKGQGTFAPLKASYLRRKPGGAARGIGILSGSLRVHATEDTPDIATATYALFGVTRADPASVVTRAGYLKKGRRNMAKRNVVPRLTSAEKRQVAEIIAEHIVSEVKVR